MLWPVSKKTQWLSSRYLHQNLTYKNKEKNMLFSTEKGLYLPSCMFILSDLFHYTITRQGKLSSQVNVFLNSVPLKEYLIADLQQHHTFF